MVVWTKNQREIAYKGEEIGYFNLKWGWWESRGLSKEVKTAPIFMPESGRLNNLSDINSSDYLFSFFPLLSPEETAQYRENISRNPDDPLEYGFYNSISDPTYRLVYQAIFASIAISDSTLTDEYINNFINAERALIHSKARLSVLGRYL
ncbi:hypothetical protein [Alteromonas sp. a30]|uniref:hypothetical protein n=1 Tax=Alteromonas sp. a30 TaxID=2730917 RepID=UPI00227F3179|nr:hypothetical protein [Alteromonas sp. a30]MCY7296369.1 hypothetical protein [Alteromonas sp. a30]